MANYVIFVLCDHLKLINIFSMKKNALTDKWLIFISGVENENYNNTFKCILILCVFL